MAPPESADDTIQQTVMARTLGWPVAHLPGRLRVEDVPAAFDAVPAVDPVEPTVWFGFIPPLRVYEAVHECAAARGWRLLNDPAQHQAAFELDHALPRLRELTPRSVVVHSVDEVHAAVDVVGLPTFVRGAMLSNKNKGEAACVAHTLQEARALVTALLADPHLSRGRAILRTFVRLRTAPIAGFGMPAGREYRVFLYRGHVVSHGFYWPYLLEFFDLAPDEEQAMLAVATEAAARMPTPWLSVDIAQTEAGDWILIETGDPQFSGLGLMDPKTMLRRLGSLVEPPEAG
jgi:hypothetical protein